MNTILNKKYNLVYFLLLLVLSGCSYSFTGASLPPEYKTFGIASFEDRTNSAEPNLVQKFREKLLNTFISDNSLKYTDPNKADLVFDVFITGFSDQLSSVASGENLKTKKISISVSVVCYDIKNNKKYYEQSFNNFQEYEIKQNVLVERSAAIESTINKLCEDILLRTVSNW
jgi:spore maturation protein CgeB